MFSDDYDAGPSQAVGWDPELSVDWNKQSSTRQCLFRIKRYLLFYYRAILNLTLKCWDSKY